MTSRRRYLYFAALLLAVVTVILWSSQRDRPRERGSGSAQSVGADESRADESRVAETTRRAPLDDSFGKQYRYSATAPTNRVTGRVIGVTDEQGVSGVDLTFRRGKPETTATSGSDGSYSVGLVPGTYEVRAIGVDTIALPQPPLRVGSLSEAIQFDVYVVRMAVLRGTVTYADGRPAPGAEVSVRANSEGARAYVRTGELAGAAAGPDGRFELRVVPGAVELRATDGPLNGFARVEAVEAGSTRADVQIVLEDNAVVSGMVLDPNGQPVVGAEAHASVQRPRTWQYERATAQTDGSGRFEVAVRPGRTVVVAAADGYAPSAAQILELTAGARREVELQLEAPLTLAGVVVDAEGGPVEGAVVSHQRYVAKLSTLRQTTGPDGRFEFVEVGPGPRVLVAELDGYGKAKTEKATAPADDLELMLRPYGGLRGTVTAEDGTPVAQFVAVVEQGGRPVSAAPASRFLADDGRYELFPLEPGRYDLVVFGRGYAPTRERGLEVPPREWCEASVMLHPPEE